MEKVWEHCFTKELCVDSSEHKVMMTEGLMSTDADREKTTELMFEQFGVKGFYMARSAVLSLFG